MEEKQKKNYSREKRYAVKVNGHLSYFEYYVDALVFAAKAGDNAVLTDNAYNYSKQFPEKIINL